MERNDQLNRKDSPGRLGPKRIPSRMPARSFFFDRVVPTAMVGLALVMIGLIVFAAGVLLGLVSF